MAYPTRGIWNGMIQRCTNSDNPSWDDYGGRGIKVCERWLGPDGFANFLADMGERPVGKTLDRKDNDGDYTPKNCRWATPKQQANNSRPRSPRQETARQSSRPIKSVAILVRLFSAERKLVNAAARREHLPASTFARKVLLDYIHSKKNNESDDNHKETK